MSRGDADRAGRTGVTTVSRTMKAQQPEEVWRVLADPTTYPRWLVGARHIRSIDRDFPAPGADFHHEVGAGPVLTVPDRTTAVEVDPGRSLLLFVRARPLFEGWVRFDVEPRGTGSEVRISEEPTGARRVLAPVLAPLLAARNAWSLARLARLVERDS
jgi:uncharacterized protein YndB with AHSA1/START domain